MAEGSSAHKVITVTSVVTDPKKIRHYIKKSHVPPPEVMTPSGSLGFLNTVRIGGSGLSRWQLSYLKKEDHIMQPAQVRKADSTLQTWMMMEKLVQTHQMGTFFLKLLVQLKCFLLSPVSRKLHQEHIGLHTSESRRGKSRSRLSLSLCCPELFLKTAQATQRLHIYWRLLKSKRHCTRMPYSGSQTLHWVVDAQYLSGSSPYSCKNISFVKLGDFVYQHESIQSSMFLNLQMALTLHQVSHQKGH